MNDVFAVIMGGGAVGLWTALQLKKKFPNEDIFVLEQESYLCDHTSSRNSGIMHSGLYYKEGSQKLKFCKKGYHEWFKWKDELDLEIHHGGKYIFSNNNDGGIEELYQKALKNDLPKTEWCNEEVLKKLQEFCNCDRAFHVKETAVLSAADALMNVANRFESLGGMILKNCQVNNVTKLESGFDIETSLDRVNTKYFFNCGGLGALEIRNKMFGTDFSYNLVKGIYLKYTKPFFRDAPLYPLPLKNLKGLGVHTTPGVDGVLRFGPDANSCDQLDYGISEDAVELIRKDIHINFKNVSNESLESDYAGLRTKLVVDGEQINDFWIKDQEELKMKGYFEAIGIESPGLTAAPGIGLYFSDLIS